MARPSRAKKTGGRHDELLDVTARVVAAKGFHAASLEDIAEELNITKAAIYYYYSRKEDLVAASLDKFGEFTVGELASIADSHGDPRDRLARLVRCHLRIVVKDAPELSYLYLVRRDWPTVVQETIQHWRQLHDACFERVIEAGKKTGCFSQKNSSLARRLMHGALISCADWLTAETLTEVVIDGIADRVLAMFDA